MKQKKFLSLGLILSLVVISSCSQGGGSISLPFSSPKPSSSASVSSDNNSTSPTTNSNTNQSNNNTFKEPITEDKSPSPQVQVQSYEKMMKALELLDFSYINKEFSAGGLKLAATRAETEFKDYPITLNINSVTSNVGLFGLANKNVTSANTEDKVITIEKTLQNILIYSMRSTINKLIENNKNGLTDDQYTIDLVKALSIYFYGNEGEVATEFSLAKLSQKIDTNTAQKTNKTFDTISNGIKMARSNVKNPTELLLAKTQIELGLLKMLYLGALETLSEAYATRNVNKITESEYMYLGMRSMVKSSNSADTFAVEAIYLNPTSSINYPRYQLSLDVGIFERAQTEFNLALSNLSKDNRVAQNHALAAKLYVDIINCLYENRKFKRETKQDIADNVEGFVINVKNKNSSSASTFKNKALLGLSQR